MKTLLFLKRNLLVAGGLVLASLFFVSCMKDGDDNQGPDVPAAGLMAFNLSPDKAVNVALSGSYLTQSPLVFTNYTGGYYNVYTGERRVEALDGTTNASLTSTTFNFSDSLYYSLFVAGANGNYRNIIVQDDFDALMPEAGQAYVRYVNAIPDSATSTVKITANGSDAVNASSKFGNISDFTKVPVGDIAISINDGAAINASRTIAVEERGVYTILLVGNPGATNPVETQIRFITNGTLDQDEQRRSSVQARGSN